MFLMVLGHKPLRHLPPGHLPHGHLPLGHLHPGHYIIPPGHIPPGTYTPWGIYLLNKQNQQMVHEQNRAFKVLGVYVLRGIMS